MLLHVCFRTAGNTREGGHVKDHVKEGGKNICVRDRKNVSSISRRRIWRITAVNVVERPLWQKENHPVITRFQRGNAAALTGMGTCSHRPAVRAVWRARCARAPRSVRLELRWPAGARRALRGRVRGGQGLVADRVPALRKRSRQLLKNRRGARGAVAATGLGFLPHTRATCCDLLCARTPRRGVRASACSSY